jgi:nucleoside phosphorylase
MGDLRIGVVVPMVGEASLLFEMREFSERRRIGIWEVHERQEVCDGSVLLGVSIGGIGMANAAMSTSALIQHWRPDIVVLVGCAGAISPDFLPGDVAIGRDLCYYTSYLSLPDGSVNPGIPGIRVHTDYSLSPDRTRFAVPGDRKRYLHSDPLLVDLALEAARDCSVAAGDCPVAAGGCAVATEGCAVASEDCPTPHGGARPSCGESPADSLAFTRWPQESGWPSPFRDPICAPAVIGTADQINSNAEAIRVIRERFGVEVEDCETTAAAHAALTHKTPFLAIRGISDNEMMNPAYGEFLRSGKGNLGWVEKESTRNAWVIFFRLVRLLAERYRA